MLLSRTVKRIVCGERLTALSKLALPVMRSPLTVKMTSPTCNEKIRGAEVDAESRGGEGCGDDAGDVTGFAKFQILTVAMDSAPITPAMPPRGARVGGVIEPTVATFVPSGERVTEKRSKSPVLRSVNLCNSLRVAESETMIVLLLPMVAVLFLFGAPVAGIVVELDNSLPVLASQTCIPLSLFVISLVLSGEKASECTPLARMFRSTN